MKPIPIPFGTMSYRSDNLPWNAQRLINWFAETAPPDAQSETPLMLRPRPGLTQLATILGMCRGHHTMAGTLYGVYGTKFYSISETYTATELGTVTGSGPVSMANNGVQITIVSEPDAWVWDVSNSSFTQITDPDFPGSRYVTESAGYFVHVVPDNSGEFFVSDLNDGLSFETLNFATAEAGGDPLLAAFANHGEVWMFGTETIEPWAVNGTIDFPFSPISSTKIERGCAAKFSIVNYDNTVVWIGDDRIVYRANGYVPVRISTHAIEKILEDAGDLSQVQGSWHTIDGHTFYMLKYDGQWTLLYDAATGMWHERHTFGEKSWAFGYPINTYNTVLVGGDDGNIYMMDLAATTDAGGIISYLVTSPPVFANTARIEISSLQILMKMGIGLNDGQGSDPQVMLQWSKDGGNTWSNEHWRSMGRIGEYLRRAIWRQLGQSFQIIFRAVVTDPVKPYVMGAYAQVNILPP